MFNFPNSSEKIRMKLIAAISYVRFEQRYDLRHVNVRKSHKKNSFVIKSHDLGGQFISPPSGTTMYIGC